MKSDRTALALGVGDLDVFEIHRDESARLRVQSSENWDLTSEKPSVIGC
jgi:hypothetical protein